MLSIRTPVDTSVHQGPHKEEPRFSGGGKGKHKCREGGYIRNRSSTEHYPFLRSALIVGSDHGDSAQSRGPLYGGFRMSSAVAIKTLALGFLRLLALQVLHDHFGICSLTNIEDRNQSCSAGRQCYPRLQWLIHRM